MIDKSGAWYSYKGNRIGQGKENVRQFLSDNPNIAQEIEDSIRSKFLSPVVANADHKPLSWKKKWRKWKISKRVDAMFYPHLL